jgi:hypothetical protein
MIIFFWKLQQRKSGPYARVLNFEKFFFALQVTLYLVPSDIILAFMARRVNEYLLLYHIQFNSYVYFYLLLVLFEVKLAIKVFWHIFACSCQKLCKIWSSFRALEGTYWNYHTLDNHLMSSYMITLEWNKLIFNNWF